MNAEGVGSAISAEFLRATATGIPLLVLAYWLLAWQGSLWRGLIWRRAHHVVQGAAEALGAPVEPLASGYRVAGARAQIVWRGGLRGLRTEIRAGGERRVIEGLVPLDVALQRAS